MEEALISTAFITITISKRISLGILFEYQRFKLKILLVL